LPAEWWPYFWNLRRREAHFSLLDSRRRGSSPGKFAALKTEPTHSSISSP